MIGACLESINEPQAEIVISDGGSTDGTLNIVTEWGRATVVTGGCGRGQQLNRGAAAATSPLLLFLHADCRLPDGWHSALQDGLADGSTILACFRLHTEPAPGHPSSGWRRGWARLSDLRSMIPALPYGDQGFAIRRRVFLDLGGFPEIPLMEDVALARACRRRGRIRRLPLEIRTTARRFQRHPIRTRIMTATFPFLFFLGISPWRLAAWYRQVR